MVVTMKLLGTKQQAAKVANYYMSLVNEKYYTEGGEKPGLWFGGGCSYLHLAKQVEGADFQALLQGMHPDNGELLLRPRRRKKEPVPGYDLCFSAPKSVSALWAASPEPMRKAIEQSFDRAVNQTLSWFENNIPLIRRGKAGCIEELGKLIIAQFDHTTSRVSQSTGRIEPQLHRHCVLLNLAVTHAGKIQAINSRKIHYWARTLGSIFRANLAHHLQAELGLLMSRPMNSKGELNSWFEIDGIPKLLLDYWSSRRNDIEQFLLGRSGEHDISSVSAAAKQVANLKTRRSKVDLPPLDTLFTAWQAEAKRMGFDEEKITGLINQVTNFVDPEALFEAAWKNSIHKVTQQESYFTLRSLVREVTEELQAAGISGNWVATKVQTELEHNQEIIPLKSLKQEARFTTHQVWEEEQRLLKNVEVLRQQAGATVSPQIIQSQLESHPTISNDQATAATKIATDPSSLKILSGVAGSGKSFTMQIIRETFETAGYTVIGGALSGVAKEELQRASGIPSRTVASHLYEWNQTVPTNQEPKPNTAIPTTQHTMTLDSKTVLVIDEAGMLDTRSMQQIIEKVRKSEATLILVGDERQIQPILRGGVFQYLCKNIEPARLLENRRQMNPYDVQAVQDIRLGNAEAALWNYAARGKVTVGENRLDTMQKLVAEWRTNGGLNDPQSHQIFTLTRQEAKAINQLCQTDRLLFADGFQNAKSIRFEEQLLVTGDRVLFHANRYGDGIRNGYRGKITAVIPHAEQITVELDAGFGDPAKEPQAITITLRDYRDGGVTLGYAQTTHKGQSQTVEHSYLLLGGSLTDRESAYVQASRGKESTQLYVDEAELGEDWKQLIQSLNASHPKLLAHDLALDEETLPTLTLERQRTL